MKRVYGIDLGTTYSCIAYLDDTGRTVIEKNNEGTETTPSVVHFESATNIVVGQSAKEVAKVYPDQVVSRIKRQMGDENFIHPAFGRDWRPQEISALILKKVVQDAETQTGEKVEDVVITCPAYFGARERIATKQAGEIAGLNVRYVIPEPTAAALAYGMQQERDQTVLVYDLGGGTFDVTLVKIDGGTIEVLATGGDHELGGKDWDELVANHLMEEFARQTGISADEVRSTPESVQDFLKSVEEMKVRLSSAETCRKMFSASGQNKSIELTRQKFDELTRGLLNQTLTLTREMLERARAKGHTKIDLILLVGGSTYMPQVHEALKTFGIEMKSFQPNLAIAMGAAIFGAKCALDLEYARLFREMTHGEATPENVSNASSEVKKKLAEAVERGSGYRLGAQQKINDIDIKNVTSKGFGLQVFSQKSQKTVIVNLVWKDDSVPVGVSERFGTHSENQREAELTIFENEHMRGGLTEFEVDGMKQIGNATLLFDRPLPADSPVEVEFRLGPDGTLNVHGKDLTTNREVRAEIKTDSIMTKEEVKEATTFLKRIEVS